MEKSMHAWAASMQMKNRAASLSHTSHPIYLVSTGLPVWSSLGMRRAMMQC